MALTAQKALSAYASPTTLADAVRTVLLGDVLAALASPTPVEGTAEVASDAITLPSLPVPGTVQLTGGAATTAELLTEQLPGAGAIVNGGFKVDYDTGVVTFNSSQFADAEVITYRYIAVNTDLQSKLATVIGL